MGLVVNVAHLVVKAAHSLVKIPAGLLRVLLNLSGVRSNVLVGLLDLGIGCLVQGSKRSLMLQNSLSKSLGGMSLVLAHDLTSFFGASNGGSVAAIFLGSLLCKSVLGPAHLLVKSIFSRFGVDCHLGKE